MLLVHKFVLIVRELYVSVIGFLYNPIYCILFILKHSEKEAIGFVRLSEGCVRGKKRLRTFGFWQVFMEKNTKIISLQH